MTEKRSNNFKNLSNKIFNKLFVVKLAYIRKHHTYWLCKCDCGKSVIVNSSNLITKHTRSCGCIHRDNLVGKNFVYLTVTQIAKIDKNNTVLWECKCKCGNIIITNGNALKRGITKSCGCWRNRLSSLRKGNKHPRWRRDLTQKARKESLTRSYNPKVRKWRKKIFSRDNYTCQITKNKGNLVAHHIFNWADYSDKRFNLNNGITLSKKMHEFFHKIYGKRNNTLDQFNEFKSQIQQGTILCQ